MTGQGLRDRRSQGARVFEHVRLLCAIADPSDVQAQIITEKMRRFIEAERASVVDEGFIATKKRLRVADEGFLAMKRHASVADKGIIATAVRVAELHGTSDGGVVARDLFVFSANETGEYGSVATGLAPRLSLDSAARKQRQ